MDSQGFSSAALRLRRLQACATESGVDGVLLIAGVDGKYNAGGPFAEYMFAGRSNRELVDNVLSLKEASLEDSVTLVTPTGVRVFAPTLDTASEITEKLGPLASSVSIYAPTEGEVQDPDQQEEAKIGAFVAMLHGIRKLGIPVSMVPGAAAPVPLQHAQLMELEKWPLIQAYGLEGVGRPGFFTAAFQVVDVYSQLHAACGELDSHALQLLMSEAVPVLRQHWLEMAKVITQRPGPQQQDLSEKQVVEPLLSYFSYGMLRTAPGVAKTITMPPRVIFGARTNTDTAVSEPVTMAAAVTGGDAAPGMHLVVEAADPRSALRAARTYFLSQGSLVRNAFADPDDEQEEGYDFEAATAGWDGHDVRYLMRVYAALVAAARAAVEHFALQEGATVHSARAGALDTLTARCDALGVPQPALAQQLRFALWQCDHANNVQGVAQRGSRHLKVLRVSLLDVRAKGGPNSGKLLGGLVYADTFIEVPPTSSRPASLLVLTSGIPALLAFGSLGCEAVALSRALRSLADVVAPAGAGGSAAAAAAAAAAALPGSVAAQRAGKRERKRLQAARAAAMQAKADAKAKRGAGGEEGEEDEGGGSSEDEDAGSSSSGGTAARPSSALGRLLTLGGGEEGVLLTGCPQNPAVPGTIYFFTEGLAFVSHHTKSLWVLNLRQQLESITIQELRAPATGSSSGGGGGSSGSSTSDVGEAVVLRGKGPACGLAPACHLTTNTHAALPLAAMTQAGRKHVLSVVLPAWQQTCRDASAVAGEEITYLKDSGASNPFPAQAYDEQLHAVQVMHDGRKAWPVLVAPDALVDAATAQLDEAEMSGSLGALDPAVEALLLRGPDGPSLQQQQQQQQQQQRSTAVSLVVGLPGAEQHAVVSALLTLLGPETAPRVALVPPGVGGLSLQASDFDQALTAALAPLTTHIVLATASYDSLVRQLQLLASTEVVKAGRVHVASVITCVSCDLLYEESARRALLPRLLDQMPLGYVDAIVVAGSAPDVAKKAQPLLQLRTDPSVGIMLPAAATAAAASAPVPVIRSTRQQLLRSKEELLPALAERRVRLQQQALLRAWALPPAAAAAAAAPAAALVAGPLQAVRVQFSGELEVAKIREALKALGLQDRDPASAAGGGGAAPLPLQELPPGGGQQQLAAVSGILRAALGAPAQEVLASRNSELRARESPLASLPAPVVWGLPQVLASDVQQGGELLFVGSHLRPASLRSLLESCGHLAPGHAAAKPVRTVASLTAEERAQISRQRAFDALPDGWCYNGSRYFDAFGDSQAEHPEMARFIEEFIASANESIQQETRAAEAQVAAAAGTAVRVTLVQELTVS